MIKLYIIVRTDMASMNPGRVAAQTSHAANYFVKVAKELVECLEEQDDQFIKNFSEWENETDQGFGTVIVLDGGTKENILQKLEEIDRQYLTGIVIDPEYPIQDGDYVHIIPNVMTCAFAFQYDKEDVGLKGLELYGKNFFKVK